MSFGEQHDEMYSHDAADAPISRPNTPSPEAKQAAGMDARKWAKDFNKMEVEKGLQPTDPELMVTWFANAIMAGYDAAAAKLREELEREREVSAGRRTLLDTYEKQLAHQQPSAPTPESLMTPEQAKAWSKHCGKAFDAMAELNQEYNKPTPEVEEIAREVGKEAYDWYWEQYKGDITVEHACIRAAQSALAQARAPLVAKIQQAIDYANGRETEWGERAVAAFDILRAALTGTEEHGQG